VNHQKNHREDEPQGGNRVENPQQDVPNHSRFRAFSAMGFSTGVDVGGGSWRISGRF